MINKIKFFSQDEWVNYNNRSLINFIKAKIDNWEIKIFILRGQHVYLVLSSMV